MSATAITEKSLENRIRKLANSQGYTIQKSRAQIYSLNDQQGYRIVDMYSGCVEHGANFELSLEDVKKFIMEGIGEIV